MTVPLCSIAITATSSLLRAPPPLHNASLLSTLPFCGLHLFTCHHCAGSCVSLQSLICAHAALIPFAKQTAIQISSAPVPASGDKQVLTNSYVIDTSSAVHFRSSSHIPHDHFYGLFPSCSLPQLLTAAAYGCLMDLSDPVPIEGPSLISEVPFTAHHHRTCRSAYGGSIQIKIQTTNES